MKQIGIVTYHKVRNYGSVLQSYALMRVLQKKGYDAQIINYIPFPHSTKEEYFGAPNVNILKKIIYIVGALPLRIKVSRRYRLFRKKYLTLTREYTCTEDFKKYPLKFNGYFTGSDQTFNTRYNYTKLTGCYAYYLDFASKNKFSYAASFGEDRLEGKEDIIEKLKDYELISVREGSGVKVLEEVGLSGEQVIDPTLLLNEDDYKEIFGKRLIKENYLLIYEPQRQNAEKFKNYAINIARKFGLKIVKVHKEYFKPTWCDKAFYPSVNQWLNLFYYADYVLTNSFHGIAFCLNFSKQFLAINANSANNRVVEVLELFGLQNRFVENIDECNKMVDTPIDYELCKERLSFLRKKSNLFLDKCLRIIDNDKN